MEPPSKTGARDPKKLGLMLAWGCGTAGPQAVRWYKAVNDSVCFFRRETLATIFFHTWGISFCLGMNKMLIFMLCCFSFKIATFESFFFSSETSLSLFLWPGGFFSIFYLSSHITVA